MDIKNFNDLLEQINANKENARENIFKFSQSLIKWMGFDYVENDKPRLLDFQTLKLKDALVPAPITGQEQLYRLTAENMPVRIRFAVLKKIDKKIINYLVDNNVGLSSYQAGMRGIKQIEGREPYIAQQPYFIHFVTNSEYKKLVLIFNQGEQKRIIQFRNKLTQTQFQKVIPLWKNISEKSKPEIAELFWKSIDIKEVNKEFYKQIKERFDTLISIAETQYPNVKKEDVKQFAVRLIGRYIFCWFLKEKGIIPEKLVASKTIENIPLFDKEVLMPLFFNALNTPVANRTIIQSFQSITEKADCIPYLNGGLFDKHPEDNLFENLDLNKWLKVFVEILENFDFTVDESSSQYQLVAIDPEMLGRIFENLLASQNQETEKLANDRKAFGAFYTPREIVDYMVNESLKAHLEAHVLPEIPYLPNTSAVAEPLVAYKGSLFQYVEPQQIMLDLSNKEKAEIAEVEKKRERIKEKIEKLFSHNCSENPFTPDETTKVRKALSEIKVLDPACGSGAFPMGVMLRLMELRQIVGHGHKNSYDLKQEILSKNIFGIDIMPMAVEIARLRAWLSLVLEADYKPNDKKNNFGVAALPNLDFKFVCANTLIDIPENDYVSNLAKDDLTEFEILTEKYFNASLEDKTELKEKINSCIKNITDKHLIAIKQIKAQQRKEKNTKSTKRIKSLKKEQEEFETQLKQWESYKNLFVNHSVEFFNTKYFFPAVKNGFDVVIGNPPYISTRTKDFDSSFKEYYKKYYFLAVGQYDLFTLFIEKSEKFINDKGILSFIIPKKLLTNENFEEARKFLLNKLPIINYVDAQMPFESANVEANVIISTRTKVNKTRTNLFNGEAIKYKFEVDYDLIKLMPFNIFPFAISPQNVKIIDMILKKCKSFFSDYLLIIRGMECGFNHPSISKTKSKYKIIKGEHISKYAIKETEWFVVPDFDDSNVFKTKDIFLNTPKLVTKFVSNTIDIAIDNLGFFNTNVVYNIHPKEHQKHLLRLFLALGNSKLINFWFFNTYINDDLLFPHIQKNQLDSIPVIIPKNINPFITLVDQILSAKKANPQADTSELERQIDVMVYKLYELTYEEVKIVEPEFPMNKEKYDNLKKQNNYEY